MIYIFSMIGVTFGLAVVLFVISWVVGGRFRVRREKARPFECGFDPKNSARLPFSLRFYLLAAIFLIFDVEIAFLTPFPICVGQGLGTNVFIGGGVFVVILFFGLVHEWREGSLDWTVLR